MTKERTCMKCRKTLTEEELYYTLCDECAAEQDAEDCLDNMAYDLFEDEY